MIFIDTSAFIAHSIASDQYHSEAINCWKRLGEKWKQAYTSNFIIDEVITLLARKTNYQFAHEQGLILYQSKFLEIIRPGHSEEISALELLKKYADQKISFTDCISFALMKKMRIKHVFGFDQHFQHAGFSLWP